MPSSLNSERVLTCLPAYLWLMPLRLLPSSRNFAWCAIGLIVYTSAMVFAKHPIQGVLQLAQKNKGLVLEFSRYVHLGRGRRLSREIFHVDAGDVSTAWLATEIDNLSEGQELALQSTFASGCSSCRLALGWSFT